MAWMAWMVSMVQMARMERMGVMEQMVTLRRLVFARTKITSTTGLLMESGCWTRRVIELRLWV